MKYLFVPIFLTIIFLSRVSFGQNNVTIMVEYYKTNPTYESTEQLYAQKQQALYVIEAQKFTGGMKGKIDPNEDTHVMLNFKPKEVKPAKYYKKIDAQTMVYEDYLGDKPYLITDSVPVMNWQLIANETKKIGNYTCQKAELHFRGSNFVAYYTLEIPIPFGPWKFKGLPGLILEVYDKDMPYNAWSAEKITVPYTDPVAFKIDKGNEEQVTLHQFVDLSEQEDKKRFATMRARMPKEATISEVKMARTGTEKIYDWEKQN